MKAPVPHRSPYSVLNRAVITGVLLLFSGFLFAKEPKLSRMDSQGDPLPKAALQRIGSTRFQHGAQILDMDISQDGKLIASVSRDHTARVWDATEGKAHVTVKLPWGRAVAVTRLQGKILMATGTDLGMIQLRDCAAGGKVMVLSGHKRAIAALAFSSSGRRLVSISTDAIQVWDCLNGTTVHSMKPITPLPVAIAIGDESNAFVHASNNGKVTVLDLKTGKVQSQWQAHRGEIRDLRLSDNERQLTTVGATVLCRWEIKTGTKLNSIGIPSKQTRAMCTTADGGTIATAGGSHRVIVWNESEAKFQRASPSGAGMVHAVASFGPGFPMVVMNQRGKVVVVDRRTAEKQTLLKNQQVGRRFLAAAASGKVYAIGNGKSVELRSVRTDKTVAEIALPVGTTLTGLAVAPKGGKVAMVLSAEKPSRCSLRIWHRADPDQLSGMQDCPATLHSICFSPRGDVLYGAANNRKIYRWRIRTGRTLSAWTGLLAYKGQLAVSPDGRLLATTNSEGTVTISDAKTGKIQRHISGHPGRTLALAFSPDSRALASGGAWDSTVLLHEVQSGQVVRRLKGHQGAVTSLAFDPDGRTLFSGSRDATVLAWDIPGFVTGVNRVPSGADWQKKQWTALGSPNARKAYLALWTLANDAQVAVPWLQEQLQPWMDVSAQQIDQLIKQLDARNYRKREAASVALEAHLPHVVPAIRRALLSSHSVEAGRRMRRLLSKTVKPEEQEAQLLRARRAVEVLEKIVLQQANPKAAVTLLSQIRARGSDSLLQLEAGNSLARLTQLGRMERESLKPEK